MGPSELCGAKPCVVQRDGSFRCPDNLPTEGQLVFDKKISGAFVLGGGDYSGDGDEMTVSQDETLCAYTFDCSYENECRVDPDGTGFPSCHSTQSNDDSLRFRKQIISGTCEPPASPPPDFPGRQ